MDCRFNFISNEILSGTSYFYVHADLEVYSHLFIYWGLCWFSICVFTKLFFWNGSEYNHLCFVWNGCCSSGVKIRIPILAILIIFEMTKNYTFILPLMLAVILSTTIVQVFMKGSIHMKHLEREGYKISSGEKLIFSVQYL